MPDPEGFGEEPQAPLSIDDEDESWDEAIWGSKKILTDEERASYDAWLVARVERSQQKIRDGSAILIPHAQVEAEMEAFVAELGDEPQFSMSVDDDDESLDEALWGPKKILTDEEQAAYDAWFIRKVAAALEASRRPDPVFYSHEEVMAHVSAFLEQRILEAGKPQD